VSTVAAQQAAQRAGTAGSGGAGPAGARAPRASTAPAPAPSRPRQRKAQKIHRGNYQGIILMEFVAAILLTAMTPVATKKDSQGLSPYAGSDIVKLSAITLTYLILAMISVGGRSWGRVAAWLGGLILLTDGLYEAANIAQDLQVFGGGGEPKKKAAA
jgi:hypothetical protein